MFEWNEDQKRVIENGVYHLRHSNNILYEFDGRAGTGKSTVLMEILRRANIPLNRVAAMCFCGAPAVLLRLKGFYTAKTIHSWLYRPVEELDFRDGQLQMDDYFNRPRFKMGFEPKPIEDVDVIFVDEAGQVSEELAREILSRGIKVIACGDLGQLPPVNARPGFLTTPGIDTLTIPMRQKQNSGILYLCDRARRGLPIHTGFYGDVLVIEHDELNDRMLASAQVVICGKNSTRDQMNSRIRTEILGIESDLPTYGERLVCKKNNWGYEVDGISLSNGLVGMVANNPSVAGFDGKTFSIDFLADRTYMPFRGVDVDYAYFKASHEQRKYLKNNKYNKGEKFEYAYALTCHSCQGNEYDHGIFIEEFLSPEIHNQMVYTGLSRFKQSCIYVKQKKKFFFR